MATQTEKALHELNRSVDDLSRRIQQLEKIGVELSVDFRKVLAERLPQLETQQAVFGREVLRLEQHFQRLEKTADGWAGFWKALLLLLLGSLLTLLMQFLREAFISL